MKSIVTAWLLLLMATSYATAQTKEIYVINFAAQWCPVCKAHGNRYSNEVVNKMTMDKTVHFLERNMTTMETMKQSDKELEKLGLLPTLANLQYTGVLYLVDAGSKQLLSQVSVSQPTSTILKYIEEAKAGTLPMTKNDDPRVYYLGIQYLNPGGVAKLNEFNQKAKPILEKYGFRPEGAMKPFHILPGIGGNPMEVPDQIVIFSAPDENALLRLVADPEYQAILPLRVEALKELTFIATKKLF